MSGAIIRIDQVRPSGTSSGTAGVARNDLWQGRLVSLVSTATGNTTFSWQMMSQPKGSAAGITGATTANASFTPDLPGTYRIHLATNGGNGSGNVQILVVRVRFDINGNLVNRGIVLPAVGELDGEANYSSNTRGWDDPHNDFLSAVLAAPRPVTNFQALRDDPVRDATHVFVHGSSTVGDGGHGQFYWDAAETAADDLGTILQATGVATGRWKRLYDEYVSVLWFGADAHGIVDCSAAFTAAANACKHVIIPAGIYKLAAGWSVPRAGVTIRICDGALIKTAGTIVTNHSYVNWLGACFGHYFNSDGLATPRPNVQWTGSANGVVMAWALNDTAEACRVDGVLIDGAQSGSPTAGLVGFQIGTGGFGAAGMQWGQFGTLDVPGRADHGALDIRAASSQGGFHLPYLTFRNGSEGSGILGISIGASADYDLGITSLVVGDLGGNVSGFDVGIQRGGTVGRVSTVDIGGGGRLVIETCRGKNGIGIIDYDSFASHISGVHSEMHGVIIDQITIAANGVLRSRTPHGFTTGDEISIAGASGSAGTAVNGVRTATVVDATHFTVGVNTSGLVYISGGIVSATGSNGLRNIKVGAAGTAPDNGSIKRCYLGGAQYAIETIGFDGYAIENNKIDVSGSGSAASTPYAVKNTGGGLRRVEGIFKENVAIGRGLYSTTDMSSETGFPVVKAMNRDINNDTVAHCRFDGTYESPTLRNPKVTKDLDIGIDYTITAVSNTTPQVVTLSAPHTMRTGDTVHIKNSTVANGDWGITYVARDQISLNGSTAAGGGSAGTCTISGAFRMKYATAYSIRVSDDGIPEFLLDTNAFLAAKTKNTATVGTQAYIPLGFISYASIWNTNTSAAMSKTFGWVPVPTAEAASPYWGGYYDCQPGGSSLFSVGCGINAGLIWPFGQNGVNRWRQGTAAPVSGAYTVGDVVWNTAPSAGGNIGWVCTSAGSPGTWKTFGAVAA